MSRNWTVVSGPHHTNIAEIPLSVRFGVEARWNQDGCSLLYAVESDNEWGFAWTSCQKVSADGRWEWCLPTQTQSNL